MLQRLFPIFSLAMILFTVAGCGSSRRYGDPEGEAVAFQVTLEREYVRQLFDRRSNLQVGAHVGFGSGGHRHSGIGLGLVFRSTNVYISAGPNPGSAGVFRKEIKWGENAFTVPLLRDRLLHLTVHVDGNRAGWEQLGQIRIDPSQPVLIELKAPGGTVSHAGATGQHDVAPVDEAVDSRSDDGTVPGHE